MSKKIAFLADPIERFNPAKDSTIAMMRAAAARGWQVFSMTPSDLTISSTQHGAELMASMTEISLNEDGDDWYTETGRMQKDLSEFDAIFMRVDPPFDMEYINATYMLDIAERAGVLVVNPPGALRDANEKMFIAQFPQCCTPMCVSSNSDEIRRFVETHRDVILKPLDGMGGSEIFRVSPEDHNLSVILESITRHDSRTIMAQGFIPDITEGDKRILLVDGEPIPYALARIPAQGETRGNLAAGGRGEGRELNERDRWICAQIAPELKRRDILFAGIDVIGDYLTEINITSPTCIRELDEQYGLDIAGRLMDVLESRIRA